MRLQKAPDRLLVLFGRKGAGGIDQPAAAAQHRRRAAQNIVLARGAHRHVFLAPVFDRRGLFAEHSLARTGRVHQYLIEICGERRRERFGIFVGHDRVADPKPLDVARKDLRTVGDLFVHQNDARPLQQFGDLRPLAAGCAAKI